MFFEFQENAAVDNFVEEAEELLRTSEVALGALEDGDPAAGMDEEWNELLRSLHTLKGSVGFLGDGEAPGAIAKYVHRTEDRAKAMREGTRKLDLDRLFDDLSHLRTLVQRLLGVGVDEAGELAEEDAEPAPAAQEAPIQEAPIQEAPIQEAPAPRVPAPKAAPAASGGRPRPRSDVLRVKLTRVDDLHSSFGEVLVARLQHEALSQELVEYRRGMLSLIDAWGRLVGEIEGKTDHLPREQRREFRQTLRAFGSRLQASQKRAYGHTRQSHSIDSELHGALVHLEDGIRSLKLMPLGPFFQEFSATVRSTARQVGKEVRFVTEARGAEIDRAVLMRLKEPMVHLVRNSVDHGLETPEVRRAAGKPERGTLRLEAELEAQKVTLRIADDGAGIDPAKIAAKAIEKGLLEPGQQLGPDQVLELILKPGFSSRSEANMLSGRGIGMDVVAQTIRDLGGSISLENRPGQGCDFLLEVPITTSTTHGLVVRVGDRHFGLSYNNIYRVMRIDEARIQTLEGSEVVEVEGDPLSMVRLSDLLDLPTEATGGRKPALVLRLGGRRMVLCVDEITSSVEMLIKPLCAAFKDHPFLLGAAIGTDNRLLPVLDIGGIFERLTEGFVPRRRSGAKAPEGAQGAPTKVTAATKAAQEKAAPARDDGPRRLRVLVVDDARSVRKLQSQVLSAHGYEVEEAADGDDALSALETRGAFDLVVTDLDMPNMDGLTLCRTMRAGRWPITPVMMITGTSDPDIQRQALEAGVDHFFHKSDYAEERFIAAVEDLIGVAVQAVVA